MRQNVYDQPKFFEAYSGMRRAVEGLDGAAEWNAVRALLPDMRGLAVIDLGCGFGWFCRWARAEGAAQVLGVDVSEKTVARARADTSDDAISYERADLEGLTLPEERFDLAYSSLAFHHAEDAGFADATALPLPKEQMKVVLMLAWVAEADAKRKQQLEVG